MAETGVKGMSIAREATIALAVTLFLLVGVHADETEITADTDSDTMFTLIAIPGTDTIYDTSTDDSTVLVDILPGECRDLTIVAAAHKGGANHSDVRIYLLFPEDVANAIIGGQISLSIFSYEAPGTSVPSLGGITPGTPTYYTWPLKGDHSAYTHYMEVDFTPDADLIHGWDLNPEEDAPYTYGEVQAEEASAGQSCYVEIVVRVCISPLAETSFRMHVDSAGIPSQGNRAWNPYSHDGTFRGIPLLPQIAVPAGMGAVALVALKRRRNR